MEFIAVKGIEEMMTRAGAGLQWATCWRLNLNLLVPSSEPPPPSPPPHNHNGDHTFSQRWARGHSPLRWMPVQMHRGGVWLVRDVRKHHSMLSVKTSDACEFPTDGSCARVLLCHRHCLRDRSRRSSLMI